jgi:hypothetical protein
MYEKIPYAGEFMVWFHANFSFIHGIGVFRISETALHGMGSHEPPRPCLLREATCAAALLPVC